MNLETLLADPGLRRNLLSTAILLATIAMLRFGALRVVRSATRLDDILALRWAVQVKRLSLVVLLLGLVVIWASELQNLALSLVAVAVAVVLATKELITCLTGSLLRTSAGTFSLGDRIEVSGVRGDVVDYGLLSTTLLEIGPAHQRTGRAVVLPNSIFLTDKVVNETHTESFVLHTITVPLAFTDDWRASERQLLDAAREVTASYVAPAEHHLRATATHPGISVPTTDPRVSIHLPRAGKVHLLLRVPTPARDKGRVEQAILRLYLDARQSLAPEPSKVSSSELLSGG